MPDIDNSFEMQIRGAAELQRALFALNERLAERVCKIALRQGANFMSKKIKADAPVGRNGSREKVNGRYTKLTPGRLKRAIRVKQSRINTLSKKGVIGLFVTIYPGKSRSDPKGAWYGKFVENGYNTGSTTVSHRAAGLPYNSRNRHRLDRRTGSRRYNFTGHNIPGKHMILNNLNNNAQEATRIITEATEIAFRRMAQDLGFAVTS